MSALLHAAGLALVMFVMPTAWAQVALESVVIGTGGVAGSGPTGNGPAADDQVVTLRHNTNNPGGNTMVARTPALTVTYRLTNQQYTGLTAAQGYTAGTGGNAVFFGGGSTVSPTPTPTATSIYSELGALGSASANHFTSVSPAAVGAGISLTANAGVRLVVSSDAIALQTPGTATTARVRMADLEIRFSAAVDNPILHFVGLGALAGSPSGITGLGYSTEFNVLTPGVTLTRRSGNAPFTVSGLQINNSAAIPGASCATGVGACGSVQINGTGLTVVTLRVFLNGAGNDVVWDGNGDDFNADGLLIGVSVIEPTPTVTVRKVSNGGVGTFNFTGTNGYAATAVTTAVAGTAVDGATRTLSAASTATTITEATTAGYRLSSVSCTGMGTGGTATVSGLAAAGVAGGGVVTLNAAATALGSNIVCTFTNEKLPIIRLQKALPDGRAVAGNQFTLRIANGATILETATTTGTTNNPAQVATLSAGVAGTTYTLSEIAAGSPVTNLANYTSSYACTNALSGGQTPSGSGTSFSFTAAVGDDLTCTFTNARGPADLSITKTDGRSTYNPGQPTTYTIVASNAGPAAVTGATVTDTFPAAITGVTWTCVGAGGGTCPAAGSGNISTSAVNLPAGATVTFTATGTVLAGTSAVVSNTATIATPAGGPTDPDTSNNTATDTSAYAPLASLTCAANEAFVLAGNDILKIDASGGGGGSTLIATLPAPPTGLTWNGTGVSVANNTVYVAALGPQPSGQVIAYNLTTGTYTVTAPLTVPGFTGAFVAGGFNTANGWFYSAVPATNVASNNSFALFAYNPATGSAAPVRVGTITGVAGNNGDLVFDAQGNLYLLAGNIVGAPPRVYRVDAAAVLAGSGASSPLPATAVTPALSGATLNYAGVAFANGEIVAAGGTTYQRINPSTGAITGSFTGPPALDLASCQLPNTIRLQKALPGGRIAAGDQFALTITADGSTAGNTTTTSTTTGLQTPIVGPVLGLGGTTFTITEAAAGTTNLANYASSWQCVNTTSGNAVVGSGSGITGNFAMPSGTGHNILCTFTNAQATSLTLQKTWASATVNDAVTVSVTNPASVGTTLTSVASTASETDTGTPFSVVRGTTYTITEAFTTGTPAGYTKTLACTGNTGTGAAVAHAADALSGTVTIGDTATAVVCTFTNTLRPRVTISKVSVGGVGAFAFTGTNGIAAQTLTTTVAGTAVSGTPQTLTATGAVTTITESAPPAGYVLSGISCTGMAAGGAFTPDLPTRTVTLDAAATAAGANVTCTFTNTSTLASLTITKSGAPTTVPTGDLVLYTITVTNNGTIPVTGAQVLDTVPAGLDCVTAPLVAPTCTPAAACPTAPTAVALTTSPGFTLGTLATGTSIAITLQCRVTATGQ